MLRAFLLLVLVFTACTRPDIPGHVSSDEYAVYATLATHLKADLVRDADGAVVLSDSTLLNRCTPATHSEEMEDAQERGEEALMMYGCDVLGVEIYGNELHSWALDFGVRNMTEPRAPLVRDSLERSGQIRVSSDSDITDHVRAGGRVLRVTRIGFSTDRDTALVGYDIVCLWCDVPSLHLVVMRRHDREWRVLDEHSYSYVK